MTAFFSDVAGFSSISEQLTPAGLVPPSICAAAEAKDEEAAAVVASGVASAVIQWSKEQKAKIPSELDLRECVQPRTHRRMRRRAARNRPGGAAARTETW